MSSVLDLLCQMFQPPGGTLDAPRAPEPRRPPAGAVTSIERSVLPDVTSADYMGSLITSSEITEAMIQADLHDALRVQAMQDELIETEDGRIVGLRVTDTRPTRPLPHT